LSDRVPPFSIGYKARQVDVAFDWERGIAHNTVRGKTWALQVGPETVDKRLYLLVLMQDLRAEKTDLSYTVADGGRLKTYRLDVLGTEPLQTALGPLMTIKVQRPRRQGQSGNHPVVGAFATIPSRSGGEPGGRRDNDHAAGCQARQRRDAPAQEGPGQDSEPWY